MMVDVANQASATNVFQAATTGTTAITMVNSIAVTNSIPSVPRTPHRAWSVDVLTVRPYTKLRGSPAGAIGYDRVQWRSYARISSPRSRMSEARVLVYEVQDPVLRHAVALHRAIQGDEHFAKIVHRQ